MQERIEYLSNLGHLMYEVIQLCCGAVFEQGRPPGLTQSFGAQGLRLVKRVIRELIQLFGSSHQKLGAPAAYVSLPLHVLGHCHPLASPDGPA